MSEVDAADAVEAEIEQAYYVENDPAKANRLYQESIGNVDPHGLEPLPAPVVPDEAKVEPPQKPTSGELIVATDAADETATISPEMDFAGNPDHVAHALEQMSWWDRDENGNANGDRVEQLRAKWGSDMGANLGFFEAFALAHPDINEILTANGLGDHPVIIEVGAILGRRYATAPGDPGQITTSKGMQTMTSTMTGNVQEQIDTLQDQIERAQARSEYDTANTLYQRQLVLERLLPGGEEPAVGEGGRVL